MDTVVYIETSCFVRCCLLAFEVTDYDPFDCLKEVQSVLVLYCRKKGTVQYNTYLVGTGIVPVPYVEGTVLYWYDTRVMDFRNLPVPGYQHVIKRTLARMSRYYHTTSEPGAVQIHSHIR